MTFDPQHIPALNDTLRRVAHFATLLQPKGISIRFLNHREGTSGHYDDLTDARDIATKVAKVPFYGNTRLGQVLDEKIVRPMITNRIASGRLERPVFVVIITDGQVCSHIVLVEVSITLLHAERLSHHHSLPTSLPQLFPTPSAIAGTPLAVTPIKAQQPFS